jgi:iron complex outermembrane receptor protein
VVLLAAGALAPLTIVSGRAQTALPTLTVTTPSPVARPRPAATTSTPVPAPQQASAPLPGPPPSPPLLPGTLLVIDDAFVPVTVVPAAELLAGPGATLTETLQNKPGIVGTTFTQGANRPVIRGLDTYRVRTQENGIGTHDVAALSEDHAIPVDPFAADTVEVIRGPAILRYGSNAIGGVVSVNNERIPTRLPRNGATGALMGGWNSVQRGGDGAFTVTAGVGGVVVHADAFQRIRGSYDTPLGRQLNSFAHSDGYAVGGALVGPSGFAGVSFSRFASLYGIAGGEAAEDGVRIDLVQEKLNARGEWRVRDHGIEAIRTWFGATRYTHDEKDRAGDVGARFNNREQEGRIEVEHMAFRTALGEWRGAMGIQLGHRNLDVTSFEGDSLLDPARTRSIAAFLFEELQATQRLRLQFAGRFELNRVTGNGVADPIVPTPPEAFDRRFLAGSASAGLLYELPMGVVARLTGQYVERAPDAGELYSKGLHEATETFEIGNPFLRKERAVTAEVGLKKAQGSLRFDASAFYTRFDGFIFKRLTGVDCNATLASCGAANPLDELLSQLVFEQRDATFRGVELAAQFDVAPVWNGVWGVEGRYDFVRATFSDGTNVPRIPPHRLGAGLYYRDAAWLARIFALRAFDQSKIADNETATNGYTMLNAEISHRFALPRQGAFEPALTIGVKGENLLDDDVRNHVSFKKDDVLQPGRTIRLFGTVTF